MSKLRTFIAIELPDALKQQLTAIQQELKPLRERISWSKPDNIHLTIKFLGDVESEMVAIVAGALTEIAEKQRSFEFTVKGLGGFPSIRRPRVLWAGVDDRSKELANLAKKIDDELIHFGFSRENRKFAPHLTLGRVKAPPGNSFIQTFQQLNFDGGSVVVNQIVLFKSDLKPSGATYTPLATASFQD